MSQFELPDSWALATISEVAIKGDQRAPDQDETFTYVDIGSIDRVLKRISDPQILMGKNAPSRARKAIRNGDVLVSLTRPNLNAVALVTSEFDGQIASTGFEVIRPCLVDSRYIFGLTRSKEFIDSISGAVQGALYPAAKSSDVQGFKFPLPPLAEQQVIADKLDTLLAQVENIKARLERIPEIIKQFRQSVLAAAVTGKLTEEWRGNVSYSRMDLKLIKSNILIDIPTTWIVKKLKDSCDVVSGNAFKSGDFLEKGGVPAIKISNVQYGEFEEKNQQYLPSHFIQEFNGFIVKPNDVLMALTRPITNNTLKVCRYPKSQPVALLNQRVAKFDFKDELEKAFFELLFQSNYFKCQVIDNLSETLQPNLSPVDLKSFLIGVPPPNEQVEIVRLVARLFRSADVIESQVQSALDRVSNLTQSILAKAFRGELTAEWREVNLELISGENSAEALLGRIKAERELAKPATKRGRGKL